MATSSHTTFDFESLHQLLANSKQTNHNHSTDSDDSEENAILDWTGFLNKDDDVFLGGGNFGDVYQGRWIDLPPRELAPPSVVIKVMRIPGMKEKEKREKRLKILKRAMTVWRSLRHPNLLPFVGIVNISGSVPSLVTLFMANGTVKEYMQANPDADPHHMLLQLTRGLEYLHGHKPQIIHGDLKADNTLVDAEGTLYIADFDLSRMVLQDVTLWHTSATSAPGTTRWKAPELIQGDQPVVTTASDVYAYAMTSFEIVTGEVPFQSMVHDLQVITAVVLGQRPVRPEKPKVANFLWMLWSNSWSGNVAQRPKMSKIKDDFERFLKPVQRFEFDERADMDKRREQLRQMNKFVLPESVARKHQQQFDTRQDYERVWKELAARFMIFSSHDQGEHVPQVLDWTGSLDLVKKESMPKPPNGSAIELKNGELKSEPELHVHVVVTGSGLDNPKSLKETAEKWAGMRHLNVIPLIGVVYLWPDIEQRPCFVRPYLEYSISDWITKFPLFDRMSILRGVASGMAYITERDPRFVHAWLIPDAVRVTDRGIPCIDSSGLDHRLNGGDGDLYNKNTSSYYPEFAWHDPITENRGLGGLWPFVDVRDYAVLSYRIINHGAAEAGKPCKAPEEMPPQRKDCLMPVSDALWNLWVRCWDPKYRTRPSMTEVNEEMQKVTLIDEVSN